MIAAETILETVHPEAYDESQRLQAEAEGPTPTAAAPETSAAATPTPEPPATTATGTPGFGPALPVVTLAAATVILATRQ